MGVVRPFKSSLFCALALALAAMACGERPGAKKSDVTAADVVAGAVPVLDHYESAEAKIGVDFPPVWKGNYIAVPHTDTTYGSRYIVDFRFKPDPASKLEPKTLLAIRIFSTAAWAKAAARPGPPVGIKLLDHGNDVFVVSLVAANPYAKGTPTAELFDQMMLAVFNQAPRLTPH
jgi:hypothetical protein